MTELQVVKIDTEIAKTFDINITDIQAMVTDYRSLELIPDDKESYAVCRKALASCVRVRTGIDARRKELNAEDQAKIKARNATAKDLAGLVAPAEEHLTGLVKGEDARVQGIKDEEKAKEKLKIEGRIAELMSLDKVMSFMDVAVLTDLEYEDVFFHAKEDYQAEQERKADEGAARKAEEERLAKERANLERGQKWLAALLAINVIVKLDDAIAMTKEEFVAAYNIGKTEYYLEQKKKEKEQQDQKAEQDKLIADRAEFEAEKKRIAEAEAKKVADEEARAKSEREKQEKKEQEEAEAREKARRVQAEADAIEEMRPDAEKMKAYFEAIQEIPEPELVTEQAIEAMKSFQAEIFNLMLLTMHPIAPIK